MTFFHEIKLASGGSYHIPLKMWNALSRENQEFLEKDDYDNPIINANARYEEELYDYLAEKAKLEMFGKMADALATKAQNKIDLEILRGME
jgi:hypothetical protein